MTLLNELKALVDQVDSQAEPCAPPAACCGPWPPGPHAQVCISVPPPILAPSAPCPVKPLRTPCCSCPEKPLISKEEAFLQRYDNFYNYYNWDWLNGDDTCPPPPSPQKKFGTTLWGKSPFCEERKPARCAPDPECGCPTGFKPCTMEMTPPVPTIGNSAGPYFPCAPWYAKVQPCPPKKKRKCCPPSC